MLQASVEVRAVLFALEQRRQLLQRVFDFADEAQAHRRAPSNLLPAQVDLDDLGFWGKELRVRKVRAQHEQRIAVHHGVVAGRKAEQASHADIVGIVVLDELLAPHRVHDGRFQFRCQRHQLLMRTLAAGAAKNGHLLRPVENFSSLSQLFKRGTDHRGGLMDAELQRWVGTLTLQHVSRNHHHRDAPQGDGGAHGNPQDPRHLVCLRDQLAVMAALPKKMLGMGLLEIPAADFFAGHLGCDGQHRHSAALAIVEPINQVEIARTTASRAHCNLPGQVALCPGGKGSRFFVAYVHPLDLLVAPDRIGDAVQRVAGDTINTLDAGLGQRLDKDFRDFHRHLNRASAPFAALDACSAHAVGSSEDINRARCQQSQGGERDAGLDHHQHLGPAGENRRIRGRECRAGVESQEQIVHKAG